MENPFFDHPVLNSRYEIPSVRRDWGIPKVKK